MSELLRNNNNVAMSKVILHFMSFVDAAHRNKICANAPP